MSINRTSLPLEVPAKAEHAQFPRTCRWSTSERASTGAAVNRLEGKRDVDVLLENDEGAKSRTPLASCPPGSCGLGSWHRLKRSFEDDLVPCRGWLR